jgi:hypothetical protein
MDKELSQLEAQKKSVAKLWAITQKQKEALKS